MKYSILKTLRQAAIVMACLTLPGCGGGDPNDPLSTSKESAPMTGDSCSQSDQSNCETTDTSESQDPVVSPPATPPNNPPGPMTPPVTPPTTPPAPPTDPGGNDDSDEDCPNDTTSVDALFCHFTQYLSPQE